MNRFGLAVLCGLVVNSAAATQQLPENVWPESYDLKFTPDLPTATFSGEETIHVRLRGAASSIVLKSAELQFKEASISSGGSPQTATVALDEKNENATLTVTKAVPAGPADIHIVFSGVLNDKLRGFYLSKTARRRYAVTQFEATDARRAFPSFDEPAFKAVFRITLVIDKDDTAISNGVIVSDTPGPGEGKHTLQFSPTPKMSTYLAAMMVGDFACVNGGADGIPIRVCAVPEKKELLGYALTSAENILKFFNKYYDIKYPYKKLDVIAFPDFSAGAMENTAAITYREELLTIDDKTASVNAHQAVVSVLAHEMAHQWFGDLVTMKWWDDIWLNEGFATWMSFKPMEAWKPEWNSEQAEISETGEALTTDEIASVRPIRAKANTPAEISTLFDGIAYGKAASVLRMVEAYLGPEVFRKGVNQYLEKHAYANATAEDFWNQMTVSSGKPVDKIMQSFTEQSGAPLITVKSTCQGNETTVTLEQHRYFSDAAKLNEGSKEIWQIPVSLRAAGSREAVYRLLTQRKQTFPLPGCASWVYANAGARGYYRSQYEAGALSKISKEMATSLSPEDRIRFLGDIYAMVGVGRLSIGDYLATLENLKGERSPAVVEVMMAHIAYIHNLIATEKDRPAFENWVRNWLRPIANDLGETPTAGESDERRALRPDVLHTLATYGRDPQLVAKAREMAEVYMKEPESVDAGLARNALRVSARNGDAALYDKYVEHLKKAKTPEEYSDYLGALGLFPDPALAKRTFELILSPEVKNQDMGALFGPLTNPYTQAAAWELFKSHYAAIVGKADESLGGASLTGVADVFCDAKLRDDSQRFFAEKKIPGTERPLQNAKDTVNGCIEIRAHQQGNLSSFLKN